MVTLLLVKDFNFHSRLSVITPRLAIDLQWKP